MLEGHPCSCSLVTASSHSCAKNVCVKCAWLEVYGKVVRACILIWSGHIQINRREYASERGLRY